MISEFVVRLGTFLILIGIGIVILFVASHYSGQADFDYLFWAVLSLTLGILLRGRKAPVPPSGRFGSVRKLRDRSKHHEEEQ